MPNEDNPYRSGRSAGSERTPHDPCISNEPQFNPGELRPDPSERTAGREADPLEQPRSVDELIDQSVWDEPGLHPRLAGKPPSDAPTYASWLEAGELQTSDAKSAVICLLVVLCAGPFSIVGTFASQSIGGSNIGALSLCVFGPMVEEMMKVAAILWIVEKRPFYFKSVAQILVCAIASGLWFAVIENMLYLNVYIEEPTAGIIAWRWTVCVMLHVGCTFISGIGLSRVWEQTMTERTKPNLALGANFIITAVVIHGLYNTGALVAGVLDQF